MKEYNNKSQQYLDSNCNDFFVSYVTMGKIIQIQNGESNTRVTLE